MLWRYTKTLLLSGALFGGGMSLVYLPLLLLGDARLFWTLTLGSGLAFGICMALITLGLQRRPPPLQINAGEHVLHDGPANFMHGKLALGGWLYLTNQRLIFRAHGSMQPAGVWIWLRADLVAARTARTLGMVPNGLLITTMVQRELRFVVAERRRWIAALALPPEALAQPPAPTRSTPTDGQPPR